EPHRARAPGAAPAGARARGVRRDRRRRQRHRRHRLRLRRPRRARGRARARQPRRRHRGRQARRGHGHAGGDTARNEGTGDLMYVVTGGAGFIGANVVAALNARGLRDILVVDELAEADKFRNLVDLDIADYLDKREFLALMQAPRGRARIKAVFHQGACSDTMERDGAYMMQNNYEYSKSVLHYCQARRVPLIYASSAAVYGAGRVFREERAHEAPLNVYGYSKFLFDQYVRRLLPKKTAPIVGLRYFNVYGEREAHKGRMASVAFHHFNQFRHDGKVRLFEGSDGYGPGEQRRDFISVEDVAAVNLWFLDHPKRSGIFNVGTGRSQPFNDVAL